MKATVAELAKLLDDAEIIGSADTEVNDLSCDSRLVKPSDLFVCVTGFQSDGHKFAAEAAAKGAAALVTERRLSGVGIPLIVVPNSRKALSILAAHFCGRPSEKLLNVGITGTNGKTTTAYLIESILKKGGKNPGLLGTIEAHVAGEVIKLNNTTPGAYELQHMFADMVKAEQKSCVMEVSSHALALDRTYGIPFDVAVFTNLTQDHLDFHGTMEEYFHAKARLFTNLGIYKRPSEPELGPVAVINIDDEYGKRIVEMIKDRVPVITYGTDPRADVRAYNVSASPKGLSFMLETRLGCAEVQLQLSGSFNVHNALAAAAAGIAAHVGFADIVCALQEVASVPGRFQLINRGQGFAVIVDYAHTPDGLAHLLDSARQITPNGGELTVVFGCGGDRDKGKRPLMGRIAVNKADKVFISNDNPRSENPEDIVGDILNGIPFEMMERVEIIYDRAEAIKKAVSTAKVFDTVVIAGKGHETYQKFSDHTVHFDDAEKAAAALSEMKCSKTVNAMHKVRLAIKFDECVFDLSKYLRRGNG
ncbi:UDP-N-acetylmuramoyl-L-alanyl-D-glutamate--2,6-diaminopimelate ligase [bacterium]|nr:UDP-N-acetylmuramoyl-L-alanyl-D-glutamate--2,6-diaminopimelate ligase [bacterium]